MRASFKGKVVVITGAGSGIGRELALAFASEGARLVIAGRRRQALDETARLVEGATPDRGGAASEPPLVVSADVSRPEDCATLREAAIARFGAIDIVVNNAGASMRGEFGATEPAVFKAMVDANLLGPMLITRAFIADLKDRRGAVCYVSSLAGLFGLPEVSAYSASKMGLTGLAQALRTELAGSGVGVTVAHIGLVDNDPDKRVFGADGAMIPLSRPSHSTRKQAAKFILEAIRKRKAKAVHTLAGAAMAVAVGLAPGLVSSIAGFARTRLRRLFG